MENQTAEKREIVKELDLAFARLIDRLKVLVKSVSPDLLYRRPPVVTFGENILRSAAILEQTFGGLTTNLWDDPFEWTLPETLSSQDRIIEYLAEVDATRERAFCCFNDDALTKYVSAPAGEFVLLSVLLDALVRASDYHGRAAASVKIYSGESTVRFII
jgi:hypothetical protein